MSVATDKTGVAVLIPSWDGREHLEVCLEALNGQEDPGVPWRVWVLDNGSSDGTEEWLKREHPAVRVVRSDVNLGFAAAVNRLAELAEDARFLALLNNDTRPTRGWLCSLVDALTSAPQDVAAVSGLIVDWEGERLDFARGVMTFDGHAFQLGYRRRLKEAEIPATGTELPFACGGNMIIRRDVFRDLGGLDASFFAYYEDVDLGWRLWAGGHRIIFCADSKIHHHSSATSERLGLYHRGFLFERNAFLTVYKNLDEEIWPRLMPVILLTLMARTQSLLVSNPGGEELKVDPYAGLIAGTQASMEGPVGPVVGESWVGESWVEKLRRLGPRGAWRRARVHLGRALSGEVAGIRVSDERTIAQLRAVSNLLGRLDGAAEARAEVQARRSRSDRDYFARFPLYVVPTYPGDDELFAGLGFRTWLPVDLPIVEARLQDCMDWS
jgi:GT2 family glycosyltransferase